MEQQSPLTPRSSGSSPPPPWAPKRLTVTDDDTQNTCANNMVTPADKAEGTKHDTD